MSANKKISKLMFKAKVHKKISLFFVIITLITLTSSLPMNQFIQNESAAIPSNKNNINQNKFPNNQELKINSLLNPKSSFSYGDTLHVQDVVNASKYYEQKLGSAWPNIWYVPAQQIQVYIGVNPCASRDANYNCVAGSTFNSNPISSYMLQLAPGSTGLDHSGGVDNQSPFGYDDNLGTTQLSNANYNTYYNTLSYNFNVTLPSTTTYTNLGLPTGQITIYEFCPYNSTLQDTFNGMVTSSYNITISSDADVHLDPALPSYTVTALNSSVNVDFQAYIVSTATVLPDVQIDYNISDSNNNLICGTGATSCSSVGFAVTESATGVTNSTGWIHFTAGFSALGSVTEGIYKFSAIAVLINPTNPNATNYATSGSYTLTKNKMTTVNLTVNYNLQTPMLTKENVSNANNLITNIFPFNNSPSNPSLRPGSYFEGYVRHTVYNGSMGVTGASLTPKLYNSTGADLTAQLSGGFASLTYIGSSTSDSNGYVEFNLSLSYSAPLDTYNLIFVGDYTGLTNMTPTWIKSLSSSNSLTYTFTVANLFDMGSVSYIKAFPSNDTKITTNPTNLTIEFQATAALNNLYSSYAQYYPSYTLPSNPYPLIGLVVNATIANYNSSITGITLSVGAGFSSYNQTFFYTDANGYINFTLSTKYPDTYNLTTFQLNIVANYTPMINNNPGLYRFTRDSQSQTNTTTGSSLPVSFNPHYTVVDVVPYNYFGFSNNNVTSGYLEPGQTGMFVFRTLNTTNGSFIPYVPFNYSIVLGLLTPGLFISTSNLAFPGYNGYNESDANGFIYIYVYSTYGVTPESTTPISISFNVVLDITLYNLTKTDSNFYIGQYHKGFSNYLEFQNTWSEKTQSGFNIQSVYTVAKPVWVDPITDKQILNPLAGLNLVRPNNETITIRLKIVNSTNQLISGYKFAVNASFLTLYPGISLSIANSAQFTPVNSSGWYFTNATGYIDFNVKISYQPGYSKYNSIGVNATVDFTNTTCLSFCGDHSERWIIGEYAHGNYNLSASSYSTITNPSYILRISKSPAYVTGLLKAVSVSPSKISPGNYISVTYLAYIPKTDTNASLDGLVSTNDLPLQGITVYINETYINNNNMNVTSNGLTTLADGTVTFTIGITSTTAEGYYNIPAYADFENDQGLSIGVVNKTGTFNYFWLNGTTSSAGNYKTGGIIQNYSPANSSTLQVQLARTTFTSINRIFDQNGNLIATNPSPVEVYRNYQLELLIVYKNQLNSPITGTILNVNVSTTTLAGGLASTYPVQVTTDGTGQAKVNITVSNYLVGEASVSSYDPNYTGFFNANNANFAIKSSLSLSNVNFAIQGGSNEAFAGEQISITGNLVDERSQMGTNYYSSAILSELSNSLKIEGYNGSNLITGTTSTMSFTFTGTSGTFSFNWQVPQTYTYSSLTILVQIYQTGSIIHFINSTNYLSDPLPKNSHLVNVFQSVNYNFTFSNSDASNVALNGKTINITDGYTGALDFSGYLYDNYGRLLTNRDVYFYYNASPTLSSKTNGAGQFSYSGFIPQENVNTTYSFTLYYLNPSNSQINIWTDNIIRTVHDIYGPTVVETPTIYNNTYIYQNVTLSLNITDPINNGNQLIPAVGVNYSSIVIERNSTIVWTNVGLTNWTGVGLLLFHIDYNTINPSDIAVNITISVSDNVNNNATYTILLYLDHQAPTILATNPLTNVYAYESNFTFTLKATDNGQTGINPNQVYVYVNGTPNLMVYNAVSGFYESNSYNLYGLKGDTPVQFSVTDMAGNNKVSSVITLLADNIKPTILLTNPLNNNFKQFNQVVTFTFNVSDAQTGIDVNSIVLYNSSNSIVASNSSFVITNGTGYYIVTGQLTKNQLNLASTNQQFTLSVKDNNGNVQNFILRFNIDIIGPNVIGITVYQTEVNSTSIVETGNTTLTTAMQYVQFNLSDLGTPSTGVDKSYFQVKLVVNTSLTIILTYQNGVLKADNTSYTNYFSYIPSDNNSIIIGWNATDIESFGIVKTYNTQNITIQWELLSLKDNFGNNIAFSTDNIVNYGMEVEALPPPPDYVGLFLNFAAVFLIFIGIGVAVAYIYEKIRYIG